MLDEEVVVPPPWDEKAATGVAGADDGDDAPLHPPTQPPTATSRIRL